MMYKIELTEEHLRVISEALGNAPFRLVAPVVAELQRQIRDQQPKPNGQDSVDTPSLVVS